MMIVMIFSDIGIVQPLRFLRQPCCYSWVQEITKYEVELTFNGTTSLPKFPGNQSSQMLKWEAHTNTAYLSLKPVLFPQESKIV
jgi:hypothetical protein